MPRQSSTQTHPEPARRGEGMAAKPVVQPELPYEGRGLPLEESLSGQAPGRVRQLRDPAVFEDGGRLYLLYSIAGENGLAVVEIR